MLFEVTFMKIDVAEIEAFLPDATASEVSAALMGDAEKPEDSIAHVIVNSNDLAVRMRFRRDAGLDRLLKGMRTNLESAVEDQFIDQAYLDSLWTKVTEDFAPLAERGVRKGDTLTQRVAAGGVHTLFADGEGRPLVEVRRPGPRASASVKGAYFGPSSRFRKKLIKSLNDHK
jgi:hypothetical protein